MTVNKFKNRRSSRSVLAAFSFQFWASSLKCVPQKDIKQEQPGQLTVWASLAALVVKLASPL